MIIFSIISLLLVFIQYAPISPLFFKQLFIDQDSPYYVPEGINPNMFDVYNSFSQIITDDKKDIMNKFEKTILINRLLNVE